MISIHDFDQVDAFFKAQKVDPNDAKKIRNYFYKRGFSLGEKINRVSGELLTLAKNNLQTTFLTLKKRVDSSVDGASKLLFETVDGYLIEAVILRIATGRTSLCISSQCGCKFNCSFCATGGMGFHRNLTKAEIIDQVVQASKIVQQENITIRNVVFMGMGEPLDNFSNVEGAIGLLIASEGFNLSPKNVMVSTCGLCKPLEKINKTFPNINLAISLHSVMKTVRDELMPVNKSNGLDELRKTILQIGNRSQSVVMLEYLLIEGHNDDNAAIEALIEFCQELSVRINLINYNQTDANSPYQPVSQKRLIEIKQTLKEAELNVTIRYSLGNDIAAACGQLANQG